MINPQEFFLLLVKHNVKFFSGVPDSLLKDICAYITDNARVDHHIIAANEGNALAIGIGYHIATGCTPLIYMQNSGLGNIVNPLLSLADPEIYSIPMLLMIGWRGEPNIHDEPQHKKQGLITLDLLETMKIPYEILSSEMSDEQLNNVIESCTRYASDSNAPIALVIRKGTFSKYKLKNIEVEQNSLTREEAIKILVDNIDDDSIIVSTTGVASRELFEYREALGQGHSKDFLTVGGMGHANQIALGIALQKPNIQVLCFDGDGALLMHMGGIAIIASLGLNNFKHIIFNNSAHDSVGGQPTVGSQIDIKQIAEAVGYNKVFQAATRSAIEDVIEDFKNYSGMAMLEIKVKKGFRSDLGRPTKTPQENKHALMNFIN